MSILRVKFLYRTAMAELDAGHPFAAGMSVSLLQDAVEAMIHEAAKKVGAALSPRASFVDHWESINKKIDGGKALLYRTEMSELNTARVGFKHYGNNPALADAEKHRAAAHRFLVETAVTFFDVDFDNLSEIDLLANFEICAALKLAEESLTPETVGIALQHCRDALDRVDALMQTAAMVTASGRLDVVPSALRTPADASLQWALKRLSALEKSVALSILQVNPANYWFLQATLPRKTFGGNYFWPPAQSSISVLTVERARTCIRIIVDLALRTERVSADLERLAVEAGIPEERKRLKEMHDKHADTSGK